MILLAALNSTIACCLASHNSATRVFFALGRAGVLPQWLGVTSSVGKVPVRAVLFAGFITFAVLAVGSLLISQATMVDWFGFFGVLLTLPLLIIHIMTCLSVYRAYRVDRAAYRPLPHLVLPLLTALGLALPIWGAVYYNQAQPMSYAPLLVAAWFLVGLAVYSGLRRYRPATLLSLEHEMDRLAPVDATIDALHPPR